MKFPGGNKLIESKNIYGGFGVRGSSSLADKHTLNTNSIVLLFMTNYVMPNRNVWHNLIDWK